MSDQKKEKKEAIISRMIVPEDWEIQDIEVAITDIERFLASRGGRVFLAERQLHQNILRQTMEQLPVVSNEQAREKMARMQGELKAIAVLFTHESLGMNPLLRGAIKKRIEKEEEI